MSLPLSRRRLLGAALAGPLLPAGAAWAAGDRLKVVASFSILGDIVANVGGDRVEVVTLVGPDGDAHTFEPTPADARAVAAAAVLFVNGLGFEGWMERLIEAADYHGTVVVASRGVATLTIDEDGNTISDPHAWQDLGNGERYVENVAAALIAADPAGAEIYRAAATRYGAALAAKDRWVRDELAAVPAGRRKIITSHDAFLYFGRAYGISFLAPAGISTEDEPSAAGMAALVRQMRDQGVRVVFLENMSNPKLTEVLAAEVGAKIGGTLYANSLSPAGGPADTYLKMFDNNVPPLKAAMLGT